jgi:hypothetical protein
MRAHSSCAIVMALLTCGSARPDTITMTNSISINGSLLGMSNGTLKVRARFLSEQKEMSIHIQEVQSIEFNSLTFNHTPPPKIMGFGPPDDQNAQQKAPPVGGVIVLRGGAREPCILLDIDAQRVHCDPHNAPYDRNVVLRIVIGSK